MATGYLERVQQTMDVTESLMHQPPGTIAEILLEEAQSIISAEPSDYRRTFLERKFLLIRDPAAREAARQQRAETQVSDELDDFLARLLDDTDGTEEVDAFEALRREEAEEIQQQRTRDSKRDRSSQAITTIDKTLARAELEVKFGASEHWSDLDTLDAASKVIKLQRAVGIVIAGDRVRELVMHGVERRFYYPQATGLLINTAAQAQDRQALLYAGERFVALTEEPRLAASVAQPLVNLAIDFIKAGKPELDRDALAIALSALPYYDRILAGFPLACARLGVAIGDFEQN